MGEKKHIEANTPSPQDLNMSTVSALTLRISEEIVNLAKWSCFAALHTK